MNKRALVIVDFQNDFCGGSLGVGHDKWTPACEYIHDWVKANSPDKIVFTQDWHPANHCSFKNHGGQWPVHCVANTSGAQIEHSMDDLMTAVPNTIFFHKGMNPDGEQYAAELYDMETYKDIYVMGLCWDYCVNSTARYLATQYPDCTIHMVRGGSAAIDDNAKILIDLPNMKVE
jgi:nicotinamidase/pyrazinamidase